MVKIKKKMLGGSHSSHPPTIGHTAAGNSGSVHGKHGSGFYKMGKSSHAKKNRKRG